MRTMLVVVALVCLGCTSKQTANHPDSAQPAAATVSLSGSPVDVRRYIDSAQPRYVDAILKHDSATISNFYTDDAMIMPPNAPGGTRTC